MLEEVARYVAQCPLVKRAIYPAADAFFRGLGYLRARNYQIGDTVVVAASPRGGSTWLAELMASRPEAVILWEPLHPGNNPVCREHGFGWQNYIPKDAAWRDQRQYLEDVLMGRDLSTRLLSSLEFDVRALLSPRGSYVVKFVNANMLLPRIVKAFSVPAVHMVRHPCAVVASQIQHGWVHLDKENVTVPDGLFDDYPHLERVFDRINRYEELLAFEWAVQNYVPLAYSEPLPWYLTTYERMVKKGTEEVKRLSECLGLGIPDKLQVKKPSAKAGRDREESATTRLKKWKHTLSPDQADDVLQVAHDVGIRCYTESLLPDQSALPRHAGSE
jgi:hypothetical protein